jgi:predicted nucleic acid-binding protein
MRGLFDTNIIIDYLNGVKEAKKELDRFSSKFISIITWMEVLVGVKDPKVEPIVKDFLKEFTLINLDDSIAELAVQFRQQNRIKLPDAIIWASAEQTESILVTRNTKDFPKSLSIIHVPYSLG